jgi:hypothetical protein
LKITEVGWQAVILYMRQEGLNDFCDSEITGYRMSGTAIFVSNVTTGKSFIPFMLLKKTNTHKSYNGFSWPNLTCCHTS